MNRLLIGVFAFVVWCAVMFAFGWRVRDMSADTAAAVVVADKATARAEVVEGARATDHANSSHAARVEQQRVDDAAATESEFRIIEREVVRYVQANPDPAGCDLDGGGLRAWRAASAGHVAGARPVDPGRGTDAVP